VIAALQYGGKNPPSWLEVIVLAETLHIPFELAERTTLKWLARWRSYHRNLPEQPTE
jgi:hypothetical protein